VRLVMLGVLGVGASTGLSGGVVVVLC
jgi:hypothetical protein